jgi:GDP-L-fucose synthase
MKNYKKIFVKKNEKIFLAGHKGLVGSSVLKKLKENGYKKILVASKKNLNLLDQKRVLNFIKKIKPKAVIICAARVGGVNANKNKKADFIYENLTIQNNLIYGAFINKVERLVFLGSSCIYPAKSKQPIKEKYLLSGPLEKTNDAYAIAKIAGVKYCTSLKEQYNKNYICLMPTNVFGINDNYNLQDSHFIPALIRKVNTAIKKKKKFMEVWGTGTPKRELMHVDDLADAIIYFMNNKTDESLINIGSGFERNINQYAKILINISEKKLKIKNVRKDLNGVKRKLLDTSLAKKYGWMSKSDVYEKLRETYKAYTFNKKIIKK